MMKRYLLFLLIIFQSSFLEAQNSFHQNNFLNKKNLSLSSFKKKKIIGGCELNFKISFHETDFFSNRFTDDSFIVYYPATNYSSGSTSGPLLHFKYVPSLQINYAANFRMYFSKRKLFVESGFQLTSRKLILEKVEGSHYVDSITMSYISIFQPPYPDYSGILKEQFGERRFEIPFLAGIKFNHFQFSIGTYRIVHYWFSDKDYYSNNVIKWHSQFWGRNPSRLNPLVYASVLILDRKIKMNSFLSARDFNTRHPYIQLGIEVGIDLKKKN